jgi:hypothetical protein
MTKLSPEAKAILDALISTMESKWISPDFIPYEAKKIAAILCAAADQVAPSIPFDRRHTTQERWDAQDDIRHDLLAIAAELEGYND